MKASRCRTLVKSNSDIVRTSLLTFFNNCADDLFIAVKELKEAGQYSLLRGQNLTSWISLEFAYQMIIPVLTTMFAHLAVNHFGTDLLGINLLNFSSNIFSYISLLFIYSFTGIIYC